MRPSSAQKSWLGDLAERYHASLTEEARSYLDGRGLDRGAVDGSLLGLVVEPDPAHTRYEGWLSIPYITPTGVVYIRFRCLADHEEHEGHGKYEGPAGEDTRLFNVGALHSAGGSVAVCEGELDALVASSCGLPTVGVPGVSSWKPFYYRLLDDFDRVVVMGDGDSAGREFVATLARNIPESVRRPFPDGLDVSSYVVEHGPEKFREFVGVFGE